MLQIQRTNSKQLIYLYYRRNIVFDLTDVRVAFISVTDYIRQRLGRNMDHTFLF